MTNDDIIRMAREANVAGVTVYDEQSEADILHPDLEEFARLIAATEREECAKVCDAISTAARKDWKAKYNPHDDGRCDGAFECAESIRARGQE